MRQITRVVVVRHGRYYSEHGTGVGAPLSEDGLLQADAVAEILESEYAGDFVPVVLVSQYLRAAQMAAPIGEVFRVEPLEVDWVYHGPESVEALATVLRQFDSPLVFIVGHASTIDQLYHLAHARVPQGESKPGQIHRFELLTDGGAVAFTPTGILS